MSLSKQSGGRRSLSNAPDPSCIKQGGGPALCHPLIPLFLSSSGGGDSLPSLTFVSH